MEEALSSQFARTVSMHPVHSTRSQKWGLFMVGGVGGDCDINSGRIFVQGSGTTWGVEFSHPMFAGSAVQCDGNIVVFDGDDRHNRMLRESLVVYVFDMRNKDGGDFWTPTTVSLSVTDLGEAAGSRLLAGVVSMPVNRLNPMTQSSASVVVVSGGGYQPYESPGLIVRRSCFLFDPVRLSVEKIPSMHVRRCCHALVVFDGNVVAIGGVCSRVGEMAHGAERYDPIEKKWSIFPAPPGRTDINVYATVTGTPGHEAIYMTADGMLYMFNAYEWITIEISPPAPRHINYLFQIDDEIMAVCAREGKIYTLDLIALEWRCVAVEVDDCMSYAVFAHMLL